jgi:hypothetical protein
MLRFSCESRMNQCLHAYSAASFSFGLPEQQESGMD